MTKCLLCSSELSTKYKSIFDTRFGIDTVYEVANCPLCGIKQTIPFLSLGELKEFYEKYYNFGGEKGTVYSRLREWLLSSYFYRVWLALDGDISFHTIKGSGRLLDIGCNEGRGLRLYQKNGFDVEGLELNERAAEEAKKEGFKVFTVPLEEFVSEKHYDVVVLSNVLEHSLQPNEMLVHVARILKHSGQVWISCPNIESWQRRFFDRFWINWHVPFHIVHFSRKTLTNVLYKAGFEVVECRHESPALWMAHSLIALLFAKRGKPTKQLRNPILVASLMIIFRGVFFPFLWLGNRLNRGDCLVVVARTR